VSHGRKIAVIGLGYVVLPVAVVLARPGVPVIGFDIDRRRIDELRSGGDRTRTGGWPLVRRLLKAFRGIVQDIRWKLDRS
jgi:UDP-N-acetyl-D-mannosaminuronate dehydrogenase